MRIREQVILGSWQLAGSPHRILSSLLNTLPTIGHTRWAVLPASKHTLATTGKARSGISMYNSSKVAELLQRLSGFEVQVRGLMMLLSIKLQQPFSGVVPLKFEDTPNSGFTSLGVVGYAGDLADKYTGEKGAHMYEAFSNTNWSLEDSEYTMLEYPIDRYGGRFPITLKNSDMMLTW